MSLSKNTFISFVIIVVCAAYIFFQYKFYQTPIVATNNESEIIKGGPPKDGIPSINEPKFESVSSADQYLDDNGLGLDVNVNGRHRFYPFQILVWHQVVNDTFGGNPILVTYTPLCFSGQVFERTISGETQEFGVSGDVYNSIGLLYDKKTNSLWNPISGIAIKGDLKDTKLQTRKSFVLSWADFKKTHPDGQVLSRETGFERDYTRDPYGNYYSNNVIMFAVDHNDSRLPLKEMVYGEVSENSQTAHTTPSDFLRTFWFCWAVTYPNTNLSK